MRVVRLTKNVEDRHIQGGSNEYSLIFESVLLGVGKVKIISLSFRESEINQEHFCKENVLVIPLIDKIQTGFLYGFLSKCCSIQPL